MNVGREWEIRPWIRPYNCYYDYGYCGLLRKDPGSCEVPYYRGDNNERIDVAEEQDWSQWKRVSIEISAPFRLKMGGERHWEEGGLLTVSIANADYILETIRRNRGWCHIRYDTLGGGVSITKRGTEMGELWSSDLLHFYSDGASRSFGTHIHFSAKHLWRHGGMIGKAMLDTEKFAAELRKGLGE